MNLTSLLRSTSFRLTCISMLVFASATLFIAVRNEEAMETFFENQALAFVEGLMLDNLDFAEEYGLTGLAGEITELSERNSQSRDIYVLFDESCRVIAGTPERLLDDYSQPNICGNLERAGGTRIFDLPREISQLQYQPGYENTGFEDDEAVANLRSLPGGGWLLIVLVVPEIEETREFLTSTLNWTMVLLLSVGLVGAIALTQSVSKKLEKVNTLSREIRQGDLSRRIPVDESGDEFDKLSQNLNAMLDRIEEVLEGSKQVTNDIAHDLRTPLTRIQTRMELLKARLDIDSDARNQLEEMEVEATELLSMFNALLRISGVESGRVTKSFMQVDYSQVVKDAIDLLGPLAEEKEISLRAEIEDAVSVHGEKSLLFQAASNLIENAIKYSPESSTIFVSLNQNSKVAVLKVIDEGPGIPEGKLKKVMQRFYRLESHRGTAGHGLGLSLVKAIAETHQGSINLSNTDHGLEVQLCLPSISIR